MKYNVWSGAGHFRGSIFLPKVFKYEQQERHYNNDDCTNDQEGGCTHRFAANLRRELALRNRAAVLTLKRPNREMHKSADKTCGGA
jgi:hypothetical protein